MRSQIIERFHDDALAGHLGWQRVYLAIRRRFYCRSCQENKISRQKATGELQPIEAGTPFQVVGIDFTGPFPATPRGHKYILTITDHFTKWCEAYATRDTTIESTVPHLMEYIFRHGAPATLLSDQGNQFHPQCNGHTERFNGSLKEILRNYVDNLNQDDWDSYIPTALFAYNSSTHSSTGQSPYAMLYGREPTTFFDIAIRLENGIAANSTSEQYYNRLVTILTQLHESARKKLQQTRNQQKTRYDQQHAPLPVFNTGDKVLIRNKQATPGLSRKLEKRWRIATVTARNGSSYTVQPADSKRTSTYNASDIRPFHVSERIFASMMDEDQQSQREQQQLPEQQLQQPEQQNQQPNNRAKQRKQPNHQPRTSDLIENGGNVTGLTPTN